MLLTVDEAAEKIRQAGANGRIFHVKFLKRSTGEIREMNCRFGVHKGVKGKLAPGERKAEDQLYDVSTVYEMGVGFKRIPLDSVLEVS